MQRCCREDRRGRVRRSGESGPIPVALRCPNLRIPSGNAGSRARRSKPMPPAAGAGSSERCSGSQTNRSAVGGARLGCAGSTDSPSRPRCPRIRSMTAGVSMLAITRRRPPHCRQITMSMANTRLRRCAQVIARCRLVVDGLRCSLPAAARSLGTTCARSGLAGANTPWYRVRCARGFGTSAASLAIRAEMVPVISLLVFAKTNKLMTGTIYP